MSSRNTEILGDNVDDIRASAFSMGMAVRIGMLFGAMLSILIKMNNPSDNPRERRTVLDLD